MPTIESIVTNENEQTRKLVLIQAPHEWQGTLGAHQQIIVSGESGGGDSRFEVLENEDGFVVTAHGISGTIRTRMLNGTEWERSSSERKGDPTPEEQMAQYEESLKNDDWGHQPC